jgi:hypothetical protein
VTALGCFGGDFRIGNGLSFSHPYNLSDILSDRVSTCAEAVRRKYVHDETPPEFKKEHPHSKVTIGAANSAR